MTMPLVNGSVVKIWRGSRGHDYVAVAINRATKKIGLLKHTCINEDGSIHAAVYAVHKWVKYEEFGDQKIVPKITRVVGTRQVDNNQLREFLTQVGNTNVLAIKPTHNVVANTDQAQDARLAFAL